jgi:chromosome segregation ATPase
MKKWMFCLIVPMVMTSCNYKTNAYKSLEQEKDSLLLEEQKKTSQLNQVMSVMDMIEENFEEIKDAENYVTFQTNQEKVSKDSMPKIVSDLELIKTTLTNNRQQISSLEKQLVKSKSNSRSLKKMIDRLNKKLEEHTQVITKMQEQLALKDVRIKELDDLVIALNTSVDDLQTNVAQKDEQLSSQDKQMNKVWYVFGTRKELKEQEIFTRNGLLEEGFNKSYFLEADLRTLTELSLYSKKAKILTNHPASSYVLEKVNNYLVLKITNPTKFWEVSRYLVIEVN